MIVPDGFYDSLHAGDLVAATVRSSTKLHLVRVVRRVTADMVRVEPDPEHLARLFDCRPLCEVRPRYWWKPTDQHESWAAEDKCRWCFSRWRSGGRPAIKGWAKTEAPVVSAYTLPWGWHEVSPTGHPLDLPIDAPDPDPDDKKAGEKRSEVRRWLRGERYVRITQHLVDKRFCVHYGALDDGAKDEHWELKSGWDAVLLRAITVMALGGIPNHRTAHDKLTMRDVSRSS